MFSNEKKYMLNIYQNIPFYNYVEEYSHNWHQISHVFTTEFNKYVDNKLNFPEFTFLDNRDIKPDRIINNCPTFGFNSIEIYNREIFFGIRIGYIEKNEYISNSNYLKNVLNYASLKTKLFKKELNERLCKFNYFEFNKELIEKINHPKKLTKFLDNGGNIDDFEYIYC